jgi:ABC-type multidrug transport system ATPase subunit
MENLYKYIVIQKEGKIIINIPINYLKEQSTKNSDEEEDGEEEEEEEGGEEEEEEEGGEEEGVPVFKINQKHILNT